MGAPREASLTAATPPSAAPPSRSGAALRALFASSRPLVYVLSAEEQRVGRLLREAAARDFGAAVPLWTWSLTEGLRGEGKRAAGTTDPRRA